MSWIEDHPFKMGLVCFVIVTIFAILYHQNLYHPPEWGKFILWIPALFIASEIVPSIIYLIQKIKQ